MSDKGKKPGVKDIKDLKAKLGLKKGAAGGDVAPPPGIAPPPGLAPPGDITPPGIMPPPGTDGPGGDVFPPPGADSDIVAPPGLAPPAAAEATPSKDLVAPPGFEQPAEPAAAGQSAGPAFDAGDLASMHGSGKRKVVWIIIAILAVFGALFAGKSVGEGCIQKKWLNATDKACQSTVSVLNKVNRGIKEFTDAFTEEKNAAADPARKGVPFAFYNPKLMTRLTAAVQAIDIDDPNLRKDLNDKIWMTHYRFVANSRDVLPRLHGLFGLLAQLKFAVQLGREAETGKDPLTKENWGAILGRKAKEYKAKTQKNPKFGLILQGPQYAKFVVLDKPIDKDRKVLDWKKASTAKGYRLQGAPRPYMFRDESKKITNESECINATSDTLRIFPAADPAIRSTVKCFGREDFVFRSWRIQALAIARVLALIEKDIDLKRLRQDFRKCRSKK